MDTPLNTTVHTAAELALAWGIAALAVWRLTHLLHAEAGPADLLQRLRERAAGTLPGQALDCHYCLSLWVAAPVAWALPASPLVPGVLLWLALSAAAVLLQRLTEPPAAPPVAGAAPPWPAAALAWEDPSPMPPMPPMPYAPHAPSAAAEATTPSAPTEPVWPQLHIDPR